MQDALEGEDTALARRIIKQFVAKIVIKEGTGTLYYTFPFPDDLDTPGFGNLDLRGLVPYPSQIREFRVPFSLYAIQKQLHPDKHELRDKILAMRAQGMSYRIIADVVGLHWTRVQQIIKCATDGSENRFNI